MLRAVLVNGSIYGADADSVIIDNQVIAKLGYESSLTHYVMSEGLRTIDLEGSSVIPPLHDSHTHIPLMGPYMLDVRNVRSVEELKERVSKQAKKGKAFIYGRGWDNTTFKEGSYPTRWDIDSVTQKIPVVLVRVCGHVALINTKALKLLHNRFGDKINEFLAEEDGKPTGIIVEEGVEMARSLIPKPSLEEIRDYIVNYVMEYVKLGVTYLNIMSVDEYLLRALNTSGIEDLVNIGTYLAPESASALTSKDRGLRRVRICGVKSFADGSFGGRTAYVRRGYKDGGHGKLLLRSEEEFRQLMLLSQGLGGQLAIHAIGDGAVEAVVNYALKAGIDGNKLRIEHSSLTPPDILNRLSLLKPHVVVQPHFLVSDWWLNKALEPEDLRWVYSFKSIIARGLNLYGSSDYPVEPKNPYLGISSAVSRGMLQAYTYEESIPKDLALKIYMSDPCFGVSEIKEGGKAELIVLDKDITSLHGYDISAVKPKLVISSGSVIYESNDFQR